MSQFTFKRYIIFFFLLLFCSASQLYAQTSAISSASKVDVDIKRSQNVIPAGTSAQVAILLNLEQGWKVNSDQPMQDFLIGTQLTINGINGLTATGFQYPKPKTYNFEFSPEPVDVFEGEAPVVFSIFASESVEPGSYELSGTLRIQACDNQVCLAPSNLDITVPIEISAAGTGFQPLNTDFFEGIETSGGSIVDALSARGGGEIEALFDSLGLFWAFAGIFLIGLALNLTPCVYPMMSVTVSLFGNSSGSDSKLSSSFFMAFVYVMGIVFMYSILGVVAAFTGALFGSWLQSPVVLAGIGILIFSLALSMFGLYEIQPPSSWMQSLSGTQRKTGGILGHFFSGLVVGVFAAPCIGPPIIALLAFVGTQGDPLFGFSIFFVMAFGLGFPYLILGTFSGLLSKMPKSGTWMVWVKKIFGVILVGVALFYLSLAFFPGYSFHIIIATVIAGGIYLGFLESSGRGVKTFTRIKWGVGTAMLILGAMMIMNLQKEGIEWQPYTNEKFAEAIENNQPVMMDFYADWCIPCLELERSTFVDENVIQSTQNFRRFKVDMTNYESEASQNLRDTFNVAGVPTIVFIGPDGEEIKDARVVGYLNAGSFMERVNMLLEASDEEIAVVE